MAGIILKSGQLLRKAVGCLTSSEPDLRKRVASAANEVSFVKAGSFSHDEYSKRLELLQSKLTANGSFADTAAQMDDVELMTVADESCMSRQNCRIRNQNSGSSFPVCLAVRLAGCKRGRIGCGM